MKCVVAQLHETADFHFYSYFSSFFLLILVKTGLTIHICMYICMSIHRYTRHSYCHIMSHTQCDSRTLLILLIYSFQFLYDANDSKGFNRKTFLQIGKLYLYNTIKARDKKPANIKTKIMTTLLLALCSFLFFDYNRVRKNHKIIFIFLYYYVFFLCKILFFSVSFLAFL